MYKIFTIVAFLFTIPSVYSFVNINDFQTKNIVRVKLWYEGIELEKKSGGAVPSTEVKSTQKPLPEELLIPLDLLES